MNELITREELNFFTILALSSLSESTKRNYGAAIQVYQETGASLTDFDALALHAATLTPAMRAHFKKALRFWGKTLEKRLKAQARPELVNELQAIFWRLEALGDAVEAPQVRGQKAHSWLTQKEVKQLMNTCNPAEVIGRRDRVLLGVLLGAGLRREEMVNLDFEDLVLLPVKGRFRTVTNVVEGKGKKNRAVPISEPLAALLDAWRVETGGGRIARSLDNRGNIYPTLSAASLLTIVKEAGARIGKPNLQPHDLRRTFAQLAYEAGVSILQISKLLGHANVATTQKYLMLDLELDIVAGDFIPVG
jgi:integrase